MEKALTILVISDEEPMLRLLRVNLSTEGYDVITATNVASVLELAEGRKPALVIVDITRPAPGGLQVLEYLRQRWDVPVIILTGGNEVATLGDTLNGIDYDYIIKPFNILELIGRVRAKLGKAT